MVEKFLDGDIELEPNQKIFSSIRSKSCAILSLASEVIFSISFCLLHAKKIFSYSLNGVQMIIKSQSDIFSSQSYQTFG